MNEELKRIDDIYFQHLTTFRAFVSELQGAACKYQSAVLLETEFSTYLLCFAGERIEISFVVGIDNVTNVTFKFGNRTHGVSVRDDLHIYLRFGKAGEFCKQNWTEVLDEILYRLFLSPDEQNSDITDLW